MLYRFAHNLFIDNTYYTPPTSRINKKFFNCGSLLVAVVMETIGVPVILRVEDPAGISKAVI